MPSKKKKYNARFPAGRIKKIMQTDEEVGKVAQAVPIIISRTLELFVESLLTKAMQITSAKNAKTLSPSHMKQCILSESRFDFLKDLVKSLPDVTSCDSEDGTSHTNVTVQTPLNFAFKSEGSSVSSRRQQEIISPREQAIGSREQAIGSREQAIGSREQAVGSREQAIASREQAIASREQAISSREQKRILQPPQFVSAMNTRIAPNFYRERNEANVSSSAGFGHNSPTPSLSVSQTSARPSVINLETIDDSDGENDDDDDEGSGNFVIQDPDSPQYPMPPQVNSVVDEDYDT